MTLWRYRCPDCRSVQLERRQPQDTMNGTTAPAKWYCEGCKDHFEKRLDAKTGELVA